MNHTYDVVIVGSGPAGLSAAIYGQRAGLDMIVIEKAMMSGGQIMNTDDVDNYPGLYGMSGWDLGMKLREHADHAGAQFIEDEVIEVKSTGEIKQVVCKNATYDTKSVIIATGAHHSLLGVPGESELTGKGVSYCATCDGAFFRDKTTAVIGGGDVALDDAIFLSRMCKKVYVIHRRDEFRGAAKLQKILREADHVELVMDSVVTEIIGDDHVSSIKLRQVKTQETSELTVDGVFIAVGIVPDSQLCSEIDKDDRDYIIADETCATSVPGIYAAGDVRTKALRQVITACSDGACAITSVDAYLRGMA